MPSTVQMFSQRSLDRLATCDPRLQIIMKEAIKRSPVDFGIAEGHRSDEDQMRYFREGKSKCDGVTTKSKHQSNPSKAVDIFGWVDGKMNYEVHVMCFLAGIIICIAKELEIDVRWGGNFDMDSDILEQNFNDLPHYEIA